MTSDALSTHDPAREPSREIFAPLLLRRFRLIRWPILIGTAAFAGLHVWLREQHLAALLALKLLQASVTVGGMWLSTRNPTRATLVACLLALSISVNFVTATTGLLIGNVHTNALLFAITILATSSFIPWGPRNQAIAVVAAFLAAAAPLAFETSVYHDIWYDLSALSLAFVMSIYIAREVERDTLSEYRARAASRALADSRADFEGIFRSSNVQIALLDLTDDDFIYVDVNETLAAAFGMSVEQLRGHTGREVGFPADEVQRLRELIVRCATEGSVHVPEYFMPIGEPRWFQISLTAIHQGGRTRVSGVGVDITERRRAAEAVRRMNLDLEAQVRERTALLEAANKDLESFAYSVSHDLRTPLRSIEGFAAVLADDHGSELSDDALTKLERIRGASRRMAQLIDDMLMLSRASRVEIRREPVDVTVMVRAIAADFHATNPERDATFEIEDGLLANADTQLLRIVLTNLIGNAWKYTGRRKSAQIAIGSEIHEGEWVFFVRDNGCGFDMRFVGKLFQPFQRLHANQEFEGTGVGLATVARIVRRHGGKVWAEGHLDRGAVFRFTLGDTAAVNPS